MRGGGVLSLHVISGKCTLSEDKLYGTRHGCVLCAEVFYESIEVVFG